MNTKLSLNDISLIPTDVSDVDTEICDPYDENGNLPLFIAPIGGMINLSNIDRLEKSKVYPILPKDMPLRDRIDSLQKGKWVSFSLDDIDGLLQSISDESLCKIYIDTSNGHSKKILEIISTIKKSLPNSEIMAGSIFNPSSYDIYARAGVDYVRVGIGSDLDMIDLVNSGIYYPMASLIQECSQKRSTLLTHSRDYYKSIPKIVADGEINTFGDICKCLALGADYVMIEKYIVEYRLDRCTPTIDYTLEEFHKLVTDYIKVSMSYCGCSNLKEFIGRPRSIQLINSR